MVNIFYDSSKTELIKTLMGKRDLDSPTLTYLTEQGKSFMVNLLNHQMKGVCILCDTK